MSEISVLGLGAMGLARHIRQHSGCPPIASPQGQAGAADVPSYYHDVPFFMVVEK